MPIRSLHTATGHPTRYTHHSRVHSAKRTTPKANPKPHHTAGRNLGGSPGSQPENPICGPRGAPIPTKTPLVRDRLPPRTPRRTHMALNRLHGDMKKPPKRVPHRNHFSGQRQRTQPSRSYAAQRQIRSGSCAAKSYHPDTGIEPPGQRPAAEEITRAVKASGTTLTHICAYRAAGSSRDHRSHRQSR